MPKKIPSKKPAADMESVALFFCEKSEWTLTSFKLQKLMYFAQMFYLGMRRDRRLFDGAFEARKHGPALRELYGVVRDFGDTPIAKGTFGNAKRITEGHDAYEILRVIHHGFGWTPLDRLCAFTSRDMGAWVKYYSKRDVNIIADKDLVEEYDASEALAFARLK